MRGIDGKNSSNTKKGNTDPQIIPRSLHRTSLTAWLNMASRSSFVGSALGTARERLQTSVGGIRESNDPKGITGWQET